jgi:hypothetical protein
MKKKFIGMVGLLGIVGLMIFVSVVATPSYGIPQNPPIDPSCENIISESEFFEEYDKSKCYRDLAWETGNPLYCGHMNATYYEDATYYCMGKATGDLNYCKQIEYEDDRLDCFESTYITKAKKEENPDVCLNIEDEGNRDVCYHVVAVKVGDESICNRISDGKWDKPRCKSKVK